MWSFRSPLNYPAWLRWLGASLLGALLVMVFGAGYWIGVWMEHAPVNPLERQLVQGQREVEEALVSAESVPYEHRPRQPTSILAAGNRLTVLVMGLDRRKGEGILTRTDTLLLASIDQRARTVSLLSIPRDLYVEIPGFRPGRINTAFVLGAQRGDAAEGARLAMETVSRNLGVAINHYVLVDFDTVIRLIDELGGVTIEVPYAIDDPTFPDGNYGYDPLYIRAGVQEMDGVLALKYMRTRHQDNDFNRSKRQQQVILALRDRLLNGESGSLNERTGLLLNELRSGLYTSLSSNDLLGIAAAGVALASFEVRTAVLDYDYVSSYTTAGGGSVLLLRPSEVGQLMRELFD